MRVKILFLVLVGVLWVLSLGSQVPTLKLVPLIERENISATAGTLSQTPRIAVDGTNAIFIVWSDKLDNNLEIAIRRCSIEANQLSCDPPLIQPPVNLSMSPGDSRVPDLALPAPGAGLVVWQEDQVGTSAISLKTFVVEAPPGVNPTIKPSPDRFDISERPGAKRPAIAVDHQGRSFVIWEEPADQFGGNLEVFFRASTPFSPKVNVSRSPAASQDPAIAVDSLGKVFVVWKEGADFQNPEIYFTSSSDAGVEFVIPSFTSPANISGPNSPGQSVDPTIVVEQPGVQLVVWSDNTERADNPKPADFEIFLRRSTDAFALPINVSASCFADPKQSTAASLQPAVAVDGLGNVFVAWKEGKEVWIATSSFRAADPVVCKMLSTQGKEASNPAIVVDQLGNVLVVWEEEDGQGGKEILFTALKVVSE